MINNLYSRMWNQLYKSTCIPFFPRLPSSLLLFSLYVCFLEFTTISFWIGLIIKFNSIKDDIKAPTRKTWNIFWMPHFTIIQLRLRLLTILSLEH
jgi:hypothetical protein